jgi:hypothetical protein
MKFTKEEAFESLKGILTNSGKKPLRMSERSLKEQSEILIELCADEEMDVDTFVNKVSKLLNSTNSNVEKDSSDRIKDFVNQWKKEHPDQEPKPAGSSDSDNPQIKTLMDEIKAMREEMNAGKRENAIKAKRNELASALKKKGVKDEEWMSDFLSEINITEDMDVDAKADSFLKIYNRSRADVGDGASPKNASNGDTKKYKTMFEDIRKEREKMQENEKV